MKFSCLICYSYDRALYFSHLFTHRELGIGIVTYSPLGVGFFAGKAVVESLPSESILVWDCKINYNFYTAAVSMSKSLFNIDKDIQNCILHFNLLILIIQPS